MTLELLCQYVEAVQAAIYAGANVRMMLGGRSVGVLVVAIGDNLLEVTYITAASPCDQQVSVPLSTVFTVAFDDYPNELRNIGWLH